MYISYCQGFARLMGSELYLIPADYIDNKK